MKWTVRISALVLLLGVACTARHIRGAQDEFNRAAATENAAFVRGYTANGSELAANPAAGYRLSLALVNRELADNEARLRADRLYGTALVLKAMCLWRLAGDSAGGQRATDEADAPAPAGTELSATIAKATREHAAGKAVLGTRDLAMLKALPGLRDHDLGLQAKSYAKAEAHFKSSLDVVGRVVVDENLVPKGHPVAIYLRMAMLSTCRAWHSAAYAFAADLDEAKANAKAAKDRAKELLKELELPAKGDKKLAGALKLYRARLGLPITG